MAHTTTQRLTLPAVAGRVISVEFMRVADRYAHVIRVTQNDRLLQQWESVEGDAHRSWPPSGAFQQLSIQPVGVDREAALLVGMAGKSHFSMSATADKQTAQITFDVACNFKQAPEFLGSTYRTAGAAVSESPLEFLLHDSLPTRMTQHEGEAITFTPAEQAEEASGVLRWCYTIGYRS